MLPSDSLVTMARRLSKRLREDLNKPDGDPFLKINILGAGVGGLTSANALIQKGYDVEI